MEKKKYLLGLDIGTNSVGWALTDEDYNIIKKQGKSLWGVRLFEEAKDASDRRLHRTNRRRLARRKQRIELLKDLFSEEMDLVDKTFFNRLDESRLVKEDKKYDFSYMLFNDNKYSDKDFYKQYPTIWHLIKDLIEKDEKFDLRKVYLACAYLIKYRGHFLYQGELKLSDVSTLKSSLDEINSIFESASDDSDENETIVFNSDSKTLFDLLDVAKNVKGITATNEKLTEILIDKEYEKNDLVKQLIKLISGGKVNLKKVLNADSDVNLQANSENFFEEIEKNRGLFPDYEYIFDVIIQCKNIYDFLQLNRVLKGKQYLYEVMIDNYNNHKKQLKEFKSFIKNNYNGKYKLMFGSPIRFEKDDNGKPKKVKINNYSSYIGMYTVGKNKVSIPHCSKDDFYSFVKKTLGIDDKKASENEYINKISSLIKNNDFLKRQNSSDNGIFPYQLNKMMLDKILDNQSKYYSDFLLNKKDKYGNIKSKIVSLLSFKVPYYVGPLYEGKDENKNKFAWVKKISDEKIFPWNFNDVVDVSTSAERFITKMQNKCQYLKDCYCLPKNSILYSEYSVLNELNKVFVNGSAIDSKTKAELFDDLYLNKKKVSKTDITNWFKHKFATSDIKITTSNGADDKMQLNSSMSSYIDFVNIFGKDFVNNNKDMIEDIIKDITLFEDKGILKQRLGQKSKYPNLNKEDIDKILKLNYKDWGKLSKKLLSEFDGLDENGEVLNTSIIKIMRETNQNFMEIINNEKYHYQDRLKIYNKNINKELSYNIDSIKELINDSYVSPIMKRSLIQSWKIILELEKIINAPIDEFYIECSREHNEEKSKNPDKSRYEQVSKWIDEVIKNKENSYLSDCKSLKDELKQRVEKDPTILRSDKIYLYFTQLGRCLYSGKKLSFDDVISSDSGCDIDHIYPQSAVLDDSLHNNKVLVLSTENRQKSDNFPYNYPNRIDGYNPYKYFEFLKKNGFINAEKYHRLTRRDELNDEELETFANRQLVATNQAAKALKDTIELFKGDEAEVIFSKANIVSKFRNEFSFVKCREANDYHHAHDAYLNVIVGRGVYRWYNKGHLLGWMHKLKEGRKTSNPLNIFLDKNNTHKPVYDIRGALLWDPNTFPDKIKKTLYTRFDVMFTTMAFVKNDLFAKESITPAKEVKENALPLKKGLDIKKYGGYSDLSIGSYMLVESIDKEKQKIFTIESLPTIYRQYSDNELLEMLKKRKLVEPKILIRTLKINTVIESEYSKFCITGKTNNSYVIKNLSQPFFSYEEMILIKENEQAYKQFINKKLLVKNKPDVKKIENLNINSYIIAKAKNDKNKEVIINLEDLDKLFEIYKNKLDLSIYNDLSNIQNIKEKIFSDIVKEKFSNLNLYEKVIVLHELQSLFVCDRRASDLRYLDLAEKSGVLLISKDITNLNYKIIAESVTGFYRKTLWQGN